MGCNFLLTKYCNGFGEVTKRMVIRSDTFNNVAALTSVYVEVWTGENLSNEYMCITFLLLIFPYIIINFSLSFFL